jgi:hypothetical protein
MSAVPHNLPSGMGLAAPTPDLPDIQVDFAADPEDMPVIDEHGAVLEIEHGDGSVTVSMDGKPLAEAENDAGPHGWYDNLCDKIGADVLTGLTEDLLLGIDEDLNSRKEWIEDRAQGMKLLGLKIEIPNTQGASDGAPVEGMSKVRHPLLQEAVIRFNANARSEFLPTDGPVKIRNDDSSATSDEDDLANLLERDMNHYITAVATEYYPDTDRMLLMAGFGGDGFKKVYKCPLRRRPVSESVDADDLIVNQSATDLANAQRVTHRVMMKASTVKRMQILGVYLNVELGQAVAPTVDALKEEENAQQGTRPEQLRDPKNQEREIYECYCELDIPGLEHKFDGKITGLAVPYRFTIDKSDRKALSVVRDYEEPTEDELPATHETFVKFPFVPGFGFYDIGLLHILGNTTNAVTAAWRLMLDNGMFANFPGFLTAKASSRQNTNIFRIPPGGSAQIETGGLPIGQFAMALPYNTAQMPPLMTLVDNMAETGRRIGGTAEVQVGEGRADVPVGTVMAMIDQAIKVMNAVHKRMYDAQAKEFQLLRNLIRDDVDGFLKAMRGKSRHGKPALDRARLIQALDNYNLVPQADPNTASSGQRMMKIMGLIQLQQASPTLYDPIAINKAALKAMGWSNPQEFMVPPAAQAAPPPQLIQAQAEMQNKGKEADAKMLDAQAKMTTAQAISAEKKAAAAQPPEGPAAESPPNSVEVAGAQAKLIDAHTREMEAKIHAEEMQIKQREAATEDQNRDQDRAATLLDAKLGLAKDLIGAPPGAQDVATKTNHIVDKLGKTP